MAVGLCGNSNFVFSGSNWSVVLSGICCDSVVVGSSTTSFDTIVANGGWVVERVGDLLHKFNSLFSLFLLVTEPVTSLSWARAICPASNFAPACRIFGRVPVAEYV